MRKKVLVVNCGDADAAAMAARSLLEAGLPVVTVRDHDVAEAWIRRNRGFGALVTAMGKDGEGLAFTRKLRQTESSREEPRRTVILWSDTPLPEAEKLCGESGPDAIVHRGDLPRVSDRLQAS